MSGKGFFFSSWQNQFGNCFHFFFFSQSNFITMLRKGFNDTTYTANQEKFEKFETLPALFFLFFFPFPEMNRNWFSWLIWIRQVFFFFFVHAVNILLIQKVLTVVGSVIEHFGCAVTHWEVMPPSIGNGELSRAALHFPAAIAMFVRKYNVAVIDDSTEKPYTMF